MASSRLHQLKIVDSIVGAEIGNTLLSKIEIDYGNDIRKHSDFTLRNIVHDVSNYIEMGFNSDWNILNKNTIQEIQKLWGEYITNYRNNYSPHNYIETNAILLDNRVDGIGYYWVDLNTRYSIEMIARMGNCGRCNYGNTLIELRETTKDSSKSHVVIVYNIASGLIRQIKGKGDIIPSEEYWDEIFNFYINTPYHISGHNYTQKEGIDFKPEMFSKEKYELVKSKIINKIF